MWTKRVPARKMNKYKSTSTSDIGYKVTQIEAHIGHVRADTIDDTKPHVEVEENVS